MTDRPTRLGTQERKSTTAPAPGAAPGFGPYDPGLGFGPDYGEAGDYADGELGEQFALPVRSGSFLGGGIFAAVVLIILFFFFAMFVTPAIGGLALKPGRDVSVRGTIITTGGDE